MSRVHCPTIRGHKRDASVGSIEDHLVVAHVSSSDDGAVVLIIEDAETPDAAPQLVRILPRSEINRDTVRHVQ